MVGLGVVRESACAAKKRGRKKERGAMPDGLEKNAKKRKRRKSETD